MPVRSLSRRVVLRAAFASLAASTLPPTAHAAGPPFPWKARIDRDRKAMLDRISGRSMQGHLSFLASDLLEGRATPSRGLDLAAEYIAAQFRRAGLEPVGDDGYFQTSTLAARGSDTPAKVRNVVGVVRGSDPVLRDTVVLVTAHYDHVGIRPATRPEDQGKDLLYNGANDDGSGTVGVIELAAAIAAMPVAPKRTIVFMAFFGEERGLLGSRHYGRNPLFPIEKTVAEINLEQIGRTDDTEGPRIAGAAMTGFDYSDVGDIFAEAGKATGVAVVKHPRNSDAFFGRSDNQALADLGVPAHTLCTAFIYPDYHQPSDTWDKIDPANLEKVARAIALGTVMIADTAAEPRWREDNPRARKYVDAWKARRANGAR
ncbi:MAG: M28 family peptidase [Armatimonadota bacterium]